MSETTGPKEERFKRLAEHRVNAILDKLRLLGQLSNRSNYHYSDTQVRTIFRAIQKDLNATKAKFSEDAKEEPRFRL